MKTTYPNKMTNCSHVNRGRAYESYSVSHMCCLDCGKAYRTTPKRVVVGNITASQPRKIDIGSTLQGTLSAEEEA